MICFGDIILSVRRKRYGRGLSKTKDNYRSQAPDRFDRTAEISEAVKRVFAIKYRGFLRDQGHSSRTTTPQRLPRRPAIRIIAGWWSAAATRWLGRPLSRSWVQIPRSVSFPIGRSQYHCRTLSEYRIISVRRSGASTPKT